MVSKERLNDNFAKIRTFSLPGEGVTRLAYSDEDWQARDFVIELMKDAGLSVRTDVFGNIIGRKEGKVPDLPVVMMGSHIDSVPNGGNYDGVVGVLSAIEVVKSLNEDNFVNDHPIEVVVFMCEESSRFGASTLGSKAMTGSLSVENLKTFKDKSGKTLYEVLKERNLSPDDIATSKYEKPLKSFIEVHIEQGKVLENVEKKIGVVTGIAAATRLKVEILGQADHSGATPMNMRSDALCAAAEVVLAVEELAQKTNGDCVGTVGIINILPCVTNVVPGKAEVGIDIRSIYADKKEQLVEDVKTFIEKVAKKREIKIDVSVITSEVPVRIKDEVIGFLEVICQESNVAYMKMPTGAGHDAMHMTKMANTGMLFIPCAGGKSHNAEEFASMEDIVLGTEVLYKATKKLCQKDFELS